MIIPEVSVGDYKQFMTFTDWDQVITTGLIQEHIVEAIHEVFASGIIGSSEYKSIETITLKNVEVYGVGTYN